jgi:fructose-specific phosphotransferase system component IIB
VTRTEQVVLAIAAAAVAATAMANETITYRYDSRGRLIKVERTGTVNNNVATNYVYDKADNRTLTNTIVPKQ